MAFRLGKQYLPCAMLMLIDYFFKKRTKLTKIKICT